MACDPAVLIEQAKCINACIPPGMMPAVEVSLLCQIANSGGGGVPTTETFLISGAATWTAPAGVTSVDVEVWGSGGAGGRYISGTSGGGGGGGGAYAKKTIAVIPGNFYNYFVGAGGVAPANGTGSWFVTSGTVFADFGRTAPDNDIDVVGGVGGSVANSIGTTRFAGGTGGTSGLASGGGGASSAGSVSNGNNGSNGGVGVGGAGGIAVIDGGAGGNGAPSGVIGSNPGGGGGGATNPEPSGLNGANGKVKLSYLL